MADFNRENKKRELRKSVIDTGRLAKEQGDIMVRNRMKISILIILCLIIIMAAAAAGYLWLGRTYTRYTVNWKQEMSDPTGSMSGYEAYNLFGKGFLKVTRDGAVYYESSGKTAWNQSFEMTVPYVSVNGDYCAVADQGSTAIYIMNTEGTTGKAETNLPIVKVAVSETGVVYALLEDNDASYISVFSREGSALDITIKSILDGDGYPVDISVSADGTELIVSFAYLNNGVLGNKIIFYNLDEVGQNAGSNRVVGGFDQAFLGKMVGRVHFSDNTYVQAFYDGGIAFFSTKILTSPELIQNVEIPEQMLAVSYGRDLVGVITENEDEKSSSEPYRLRVFRTNAQEVFSVPFRMNFDSFVIDGDHVLIFNHKTLLIYDLKGKLRFSGDMEEPLLCARVSAEVPSLLGMGVLLGNTGGITSIKLH